MNRLFSVLIVLGLLAVLPGVAAASRDYYSATAPVADNSEAERNKAIGAALEKVLIRLTGASGIADYPGVRDLLARAANYAVEFGYVEEGGSGLAVSVSFNPADIDRFLRDRQLPVWPAKRSPLLVWVLKEADGQPPGFVTPDEDQPLYRALGQQFSERAMPVRFPVYDLEDMLTLPEEAAWGFSAEQITQAAARYGLAHWLVVRCYQAGSGEWRLSWMVGGAGETSLDNLDAPELEPALAQAVRAAVDKVAAATSYIPSKTASTLVVEVSGVADYANYRKLVELFSGLSLVRSVAVDSLAERQVALALAVEGTRQELAQALAAYDQLAVAPEQPTEGVLAVVWRPAAYP